MGGNVAVAHEIDALLNQLSRLGVRCRQPDEVRGYLLESPDWIGVIIQAVQAVRRHLPEARLQLAVSRDPEIEDRYLSLCIRTHAYDDATLHRIEAAEGEFIHLLTSREGWLQLTTDLQAPTSI